MADKNKAYLISDERLEEIAKYIIEWEQLASFLGFTKAEVVEIRKDNASSYRQQKVSFLRRWKQICGDGATYYALSRAAKTISGEGELVAFIDNIRDVGGCSGPESPNFSNTKNTPNITEDEARLALVVKASESWWSTVPAKNLTFVKIIPFTTIHYKLETFIEERLMEPTSIPYSGGPIDGPKNGPAPGPHDITAHPNNIFKDHEKKFEVPHTASLKVCHECKGVGKMRCEVCLGGGKVTCGECKGTGSKVQQQNNNGDEILCTGCLGAGKKTCSTCQGLCMTKCNVCQAKHKLKWYTQLTVSWKNNVDTRSVNSTDLSSRQIQEGKGELAFEETNTSVYPVTNFDAVNNFSCQLIALHKGKFFNKHILSQRHSIRIIPVYEANCNYNGKDFNYYVYGDDKKVYAPDYPSKCCECTII